MTSEELGNLIAKFVSDPRSVLFVGAGVGCRVNLPSWKDWLGKLAKICREYDEAVAGELMEYRVLQGDYLGAATVYKTCRRIPEGERFSRMAEPFRHRADELPLDRLQTLVSLPVSAIVTTNYDRSLHDAYAKFRGSSAMPLELRDATLRNGALITEFFIARIHGRAEVPQSMILDDRDYAVLAADKDYIDFLVTLLRQRPTLFVGFSFMDPAIESVLKLYKENFGPNFPTLHLAVVPDDNSSTLFSALAAVNIRTVIYDMGEDHKELWRAIRLAFEGISSEQLLLGLPAILPKDLPPSNLHRVVAFAYARSKTPQAAARPALEMVQDGVLLSILDDEPSSHLEKTIAVERLRELLRIDESTATSFFDDSLQRLKVSGDIEETERYIRRRSKPVLMLDQQLEKLSKGVSNRLAVIQGKAVGDVKVETLANIWEELFMIRAWDLAAQYAGSIVSRGIGIEECLSAICTRWFPGRNAFAEHLSEAFISLITRPERKEADALAEISRTAITVNVLFASTRHSLSHAYTLPTKLYLDASVLLPAIAEGHPMQKGYIAAINKLQRAAKRAGLRCDLVVGTQFLEEILKHRENAIDLVTKSDLENPDSLASHIIFYGAENTNVFVGAFSSRYAESMDKRHSFSNFLKGVAPYKSEQELVLFLEKQGIAAEEMDFTHKNNVEFSHIFNNLNHGYERQMGLMRKPKEKVLIKHEAQQLARLFLDVSGGKRSVFVTADTKLQRVVQGSEDLERLTGSVLSQIGFVGLVDLLVGLTPDREVFTRLMWACPRNDVQRHIRDYLVAVTLRQYDDAMTRAMPEVLNDVVSAAQNEISMYARQPGSATDPDDVKETASFLDRLENQYFERMRKVIEARSEK